jgi:hypothetical protein
MMKQFVVFFAALTMLSSGVVYWTPTIATQMAAATMRPADANERVPRSQCTECKGTGKVTAGDTVVVVERDCTNCYPDGDDSGDVGPQCVCCKCKQCDCKPVCKCCECDDCCCDEAKLTRRVVMVTADWCGPCQQWKQKVAPPLKRSGWKIGSEPDGHVQYVEWEQGMADKLPTFILMINEQEVARHEGYLNVNQFAGFYSTEVDPTFFQVNLGSVERGQINQLNEIIKFLGDSGSIVVTPQRGGTLRLSDTATLSIDRDLRLQYRKTAEGVSIQCMNPPAVRLRFLRGRLRGVDVTADRVNINLRGLPNAFMEIK